MLQNKFVYPNFAAVSLRPPATQPWKLKLGDVFVFFLLLFLLHLHSFILMLNTTLTSGPTYFPGAWPLQLSSPGFSSSQQETFRSFAVWLSCSQHSHLLIHSQAADIAIISLCFFVHLLGWLQGYHYKCSSFIVRVMCMCFKGNKRASPCVQSITFAHDCAPFNLQRMDEHTHLLNPLAPGASDHVLWSV